MSIQYLTITALYDEFYVANFKAFNNPSYNEDRKLHVRRGKGHKDRLVPLPDLALQGLRALWKKHSHPYLLFPNANGLLKTVQKATTHMDCKQRLKIQPKTPFKNQPPKLMNAPVRHWQ